MTVQVQKYEKTKDVRKMMTHAALNEAIRRESETTNILSLLPARTATSMRYDKGAKNAVAWDEGGNEIKINLPLEDGWYLTDGNPFAIPNGKPSSIHDPNALYLWRSQGSSFNGPLGRGDGYYVNRGRCVYAGDGIWSGDAGVAIVGREATVPLVQVPIEKLANIADPQQLRQDAAQLRQMAENLQKRFEGWDQALVEVVKPMFEKAARFIEVAEAIEKARK